MLNPGFYPWRFVFFPPNWSATFLQCVQVVTQLTSEWNLPKLKYKVKLLYHPVKSFSVGVKHAQAMSQFEFREFGVVTNGEIDLKIRERCPVDQFNGEAPVYKFNITLTGSNEPIGSIDLRLGNTHHIIMYAGHIGYRIKQSDRGHRYAAKACSLIKPVALSSGLKTLWITCNPDNYASRRTCEIIGCQLVEIVDLPKNTDMYRKGERKKCRYRWELLNT